MFYFSTKKNFRKTIVKICLANSTIFNILLIKLHFFFKIFNASDDGRMKGRYDTQAWMTFSGYLYNHNHIHA